MNGSPDSLPEEPRPDSVALQRKKEQLEALLESQGWRILESLVEEQRVSTGKMMLETRLEPLDAELFRGTAIGMLKALELPKIMLESIDIELEKADAAD
jgi:hypothetical protein